METLTQFRSETRAWLEANCPPSMRTPMGEAEIVWGGRNARFSHPDARLWLERMAQKGWTAPTWPLDYGGGGLSGEQNAILQQELRRLQCRPALQSFGLWMLGPVLLEFANEAQKQTHLPPIVRGEIRWCQGYSEPGAGSDLAGLQTRCEEQDDHYLVNGQKIWTSYADQADWCFCLVRTDPGAAKHNGISFILIDMASPGVSTSPIRLISGASPFCQTFFDNVRVPKENLIGEPNKGWTIAKRLLQHERSMLSGMGGMGGGGRRSLPKLAKQAVDEVDGRIADPLLRDHITRHRMDSRAFALTLQRSAEEQKAGQSVGAVSSMFKYYGTELNKRNYELLIESLGTQALGWSGPGFSDDELLIPREWLRSKGNSIEGGTSEVQLNVIAKQVLGLPD